MIHIIMSYTYRKFAMPTQSRCIYTHTSNFKANYVNHNECKNIGDTLNVLVLIPGGL